MNQQVNKKTNLPKQIYIIYSTTSYAYSTYTLDPYYGSHGAGIE